MESIYWIPVSSFVSKPSYKNLYGFGYDKSGDDYVVVVFSHVSIEANVVSSHLEFFSIIDNTWKEIEGNHFPYIGDHTSGLLFNEAIHWLAWHHYLDWGVIVAFDLMERKLFEIPLPNNVEHEVTSYPNSGLWVFGKFLSVWVPGCGSDTIEI